MLLQSYAIPDVPLIPQDKDMACWYASARMLIQWRRKRTRSTEVAFSDPAEVPAAVKRHKANDGLPWDANVRFAKLLGLQPVPFMTPTDGAIYEWLRIYGPIWAAGNINGFGHVAVITGISQQGLSINDPWPVNVGRKYWTDFGWVTKLLEFGSATTETNFLHFPY